VKSRKQIISLIAAIGKNRELGFKNDLIWKIPEDVTFFKKTTSGHTVVMGQRTYESIGRPLPKRKNIVLTRDRKFKAKGCLIAYSIDEALEIAGDEEVFIIGGGQIYAQTIKLADKLYLTIIDKDAPADTYFPDFSDFKISKKLGGGNFSGVKFEFLEFEKS